MKVKLNYKSVSRTRKNTAYKCILLKLLCKRKKNIKYCTFYIRIKFPDTSLSQSEKTYKIVEKKTHKTVYFCELSDFSEIFEEFFLLGFCYLGIRPM